MLAGRTAVAGALQAAAVAGHQLVAGGERAAGPLGPQPPGVFQGALAREAEGAFEHGSRLLLHRAALAGGAGAQALDHPRVHVLQHQVRHAMSSATFQGVTGRTSVTKYSVSPKQDDGTPRCCS